MEYMILGINAHYGIALISMCALTSTGLRQVAALTMCIRAQPDGCFRFETLHLIGLELIYRYELICQAVIMLSRTDDNLDTCAFMPYISELYVTR